MSSTHRKLILVVIAAIALTTFVVGCGRNSVARVDGSKIARQEYYNRLERLPYRDPVNGRQSEAGAWVLERMITEQLILRLSEKDKVPPTEDQIDERLANAQKQPDFATNLKEAGVTKDQLREMLRIEQAAFNLQTKGVKVSDKEIKAYYEANKTTRFTDAERAFVSAIFVNSRADADKALSLLEKGVEFSTVARTLCSSPTLAAQGGRLREPIVRGDRRVPELVQNIILDTPKGKYTKLIPGDGGGFVIFKVNNHLPEKTKSLKEVEYSIRQQLMVQKGVEKKNINVEEQLAKYREKAKIEISIDRYKKQLTPQKQKNTTGEE